MSLFPGYTKGLIVNLNNDKVKQRAKEFAEIIMRLSRPHDHDTNTTKTAFRIIKHPTSNFGAMLFDENYEIPIRLKDEDGNWLRKAVVVYRRFAEIIGITETQAKNYVENNTSFRVEQALQNLPNGVYIHTINRMIKDGWFEE